MTLAVALAARALTGPAYLGYDAVWALIWGRQIAAGELPDFEVAGAPTPHPLANLAGAVLAPLGAGAAGDVMLALTYLALGGLAWACWRLGRAVAGPWVGGLFALLAVTRPTLLLETAQALIDIPFLLLVVWAAALEVEQRRRGLPVLVLLGLAGLLRPEAWLLAGAYGLWVISGQAAWAARARTAAAAAAAPALWLLFDWIATGDPLHSLHGTQELAASLRRPREFDTALTATPFYLRETLGETVVWIGLAGVLAAVAAGRDEVLVPLAAGGLGLLAFLALGVSQLPLLTRYLLLPALMLALFAAVALLGWTRLAPAGWRRGWMAAAALLAAGLALTLPAQADRIDGAIRFTEARSAVQRDLETLAGDPVLRDCPRISAPDHRPRALLAWWLDRDPADIPIGPGRGRTVAYADAAAAGLFSVTIPPPAPGLPPGAEPAAESGAFVAGGAC